MLLSIRRLDARKVWALWPLTFLPDIDYFVSDIHRALTGNVFIMLPFLGVLLWAAWGPKRRPQLVEWMVISIIYLGSHLIMDVFTGGSVLLWPITDYNFCFLAYILVRTATNTMEPHFESCSAPGVPVVSEVYPWLSVTEGAILAFVLPIGLAMAALNAYRYARDRRAATVTHPEP